MVETPGLHYQSDHWCLLLGHLQKGESSQRPHWYRYALGKGRSTTLCYLKNYRWNSQNSLL